MSKAVRKDLHDQQVLYEIRKILDNNKEYQKILKTTNTKPQPVIENIPIWNYE